MADDLLMMTLVLLPLSVLTAILLAGLDDKGPSGLED